MMGSTPYDTDDDWESEGELDLADDESLPWLEAADDEGDAAGFDTSRLVMLGTLAITLLAAVVGGPHSTLRERLPPGSFVGT